MATFPSLCLSLCLRCVKDSVITDMRASSLVNVTAFSFSRFLICEDSFRDISGYKTKIAISLVLSSMNMNSNQLLTPGIFIAMIPCSNSSPASFTYYK